MVQWWFNGGLNKKTNGGLMVIFHGRKQNLTLSISQHDEPFNFCDTLP